MKALQLCCLLPLLPLLVLAQNRFLPMLIPDDYDNEVAPIDSRGQVLVNTSLQILTFDGDKLFRLETDLTLCMKWYDRRILPFDINDVADTIPEANYTENLVILTDFERLWIPNVYFRNAFDSRIHHHGQYVEVWPDSQMLNLCSRMSITFICRFVLSNFPFDEHYCYFELESFGRDVPFLHLQMHDYIQSPGHNDQFRVRGSMLGYCEAENMDPFHDIYHTVPVRGNNESCIYSGLRLVRHVNYYIIRYYLTSFLLVIMMFVEFYYPTNAWPARIILTCVVEINVIGISRQVYSEVPSKDVTSLFWWLWWCQFMVYMGLIEFALALAWVQFVFDKKIAHAKDVESPDGHYFGKKGWYFRAGLLVERWLHALVGPIPFFANPEGRNKVDYVSRFVFPFVYLFGMLVYIVATIPAWATKY